VIDSPDAMVTVYAVRVDAASIVTSAVPGVTTSFGTTPPVQSVAVFQSPLASVFQLYLS
jgi:hypothetical protein